MSSEDAREQLAEAAGAITKPGLYFDLPMADYIGDPCPEPSLSASTIGRLVQKSPLKAWHWHPRLGGTANWSKAAAVGSAAHSLVLEGADIIKVVDKASKAPKKKDEVPEEFVPKNWQTKSAKNQREEIRRTGRIPLLTHEAAEVYAMAKLAGAALLEEAGEGVAEVTVIWREANDIWCRARADWLPKDVGRPVVDYKTTKKSAEPGEWIRQTLYQDGYDISAAWYLRGLKALGEERPEYKFLVQEQTAPYDYSWVGLGADCEAIHDVEKWISKAVRVWAECLESGKWPGYPKHTHYADPSPWRAIQIEDSVLADEMVRETFGGETG